MCASTHARLWTRVLLRTGPDGATRCRVGCLHSALAEQLPTEPAARGQAAGRLAAVSASAQRAPVGAVGTYPAVTPPAHHARARRQRLW
eukprot:6195106-Pleurochrysis_carterae.AAC.2